MNSNINKIGQKVVNWNKFNKRYLFSLLYYYYYLCSQLFGEDDPDQDVSPDTADPEAVGSAGEKALANEANNGNVQRVSTRQWALDNDYDPAKLFNKFFQDDIKYLLSMGMYTYKIHNLD